MIRAKLTAGKATMFDELTGGNRRADTEGATVAVPVLERGHGIGQRPSPFRWKMRWRSTRFGRLGSAFLSKPISKSTSVWHVSPLTVIRHWVKVVVKSMLFALDLVGIDIILGVVEIIMLLVFSTADLLVVVVTWKLK